LTLIQKIITVLLLATVTSYAQNIMILPDVSGDPGDALDVLIEIENSDEFIGFQLDFIIPVQAEFVENSVELSVRSQRHILNTGITNGNHLRILSYSFDESPFTGNEGAVVQFLISLGDSAGVFPFEIEEPIIVDANSRNILTSTQVGSLEILGDNEEVGLENVLDVQNLEFFQSYPNPFNSSTIFNYYLPVNSLVKVNIFDAHGRIVKDWTVKKQTSGFHQVVWVGDNESGMRVGNGVYLCIIQFGLETVSKKVILLR